MTIAYKHRKKAIKRGEWDLSKHPHMTEEETERELSKGFSPGQEISLPDGRHVRYGRPRSKRLGRRFPKHDFVGGQV